MPPLLMQLVPFTSLPDTWAQTSFPFVCKCQMGDQDKPTSNGQQEDPVYRQPGDTQFEYMQ